MHRPYTYLFQTPNQSPISRENEVQRFDGFKDGPIELRYTEIRSINDDLIWSFLTGRKFTYSQSYIDRLKEKKTKKRLGTKIDQRRFFVVSAIPFSESKLVGEVSSRKYGESLTDLEFAHLSPGSRPASRTAARLRDESPCIRSLVSARDAIRCQILPGRIEFSGCYRLTVASAHVLPGPRWLSVTSASVNGTTDSVLLGNTAGGGATCR